MKAEFVKLTETAILPTYAHYGDAGADLYADMSWSLFPGERKLISTGIAGAIPYGYEGQIRSRSGNALKHGVIVLNSPGTVDSGYRGEWGIILYNAGQTSFEISPGDRIAQVVFSKVEHANLEVVDELPAAYDTRGAGGYGSSGR